MQSSSAGDNAHFGSRSVSIEDSHEFEGLIIESEGERFTEAAHLLDSASLKLALSQAQAQKEADEKAALSGRAASLIIEEELEHEFEDEEAQQELQDEKDFYENEQDAFTELDKDGNPITPEPEKATAAKGGAQKEYQENDPLWRYGSTTSRRTLASTFADMESLKLTYGLTSAQLRVELYDTNEEHRIEHLMKTHESGFSRSCIFLAHDACFQSFFAILILCNAGFMAYEANHNLVTGDDLKKTVGGLLISNLFTGLFLLEAIVNTFGSVRPILKDPYLVFDIVIVCIAVLDNWIMTPISLAMTEEGSVDFDVLTTLRVFRLLRVTKLFRLVRFLRPYRTLLICIANCISVMFWMLVCLMFLSFIFTLFITLLIPGIDVDVADGYPSGANPRSRFGFFGQSLLTLQMVMVGGMNWGSEIFEPFHNGPISAALVAYMFLAFIISCMVCVSNLVCALFVERMINASEEDEDYYQREQLLKNDNEMQELRNVLNSLDSDGDGRLSRQDFLSRVEEEGDLGHVCELVGVCTVKEAEDMFDQVEVDERGLAAIEEFLLLLMRYRESSKDIDLLAINYQQQKALRFVSAMAMSCKRDVANMQSATDLAQGSVFKISKKVNRLRQTCQKLLSEQEDDLRRERPDEADDIMYDMADDIIGRGHETSIHKEHKKAITRQLDKQFEFRKRLDRIAQQLDHLRAANADSNLSAATQSSSKYQMPIWEVLGVKPKTATIKQATWRRILEEDVKPWLRKELAKLHDAREDSEISEVHAGRLQHDVTTTGPDAQSSLLTYPSLSPICEGSPWETMCPSEPAAAIVATPLPGRLMAEHHSQLKAESLSRMGKKSLGSMK